MWSSPPPVQLRARPTVAQALRGWSARQYAVAVAAAAAYAVTVGLATVIIPNPIFARDIPVVAWNYPVWIVTALLVGVLAATYVRTPGEGGALSSRREQRSGRAGVAGGLLTWFAVGCPVCNKIALLALGYTGALTWFAPVQPFLALAALGLAAWAVVVRLRGQVACPLPVGVARA